MKRGRSIDHSKRVGLIAVKHLAYTKRFCHPPPPVSGLGFYTWLSDIDLALYTGEPNLLFLKRAFTKLGNETDNWYKEFWEREGLKFKPNGHADFDDKFK